MSGARGVKHYIQSRALRMEYVRNARENMKKRLWLIKRAKNSFRNSEISLNKGEYKNG